jgi:hypothetical protein
MAQRSSTNQQKREIFGIPEELYPWQQLVLDIVLTRSSREILWVWSAAGNTGKTTLAKLLTLEHNAVLLDGKRQADILHAAAKYISKLDEDEAFSRQHIFLLDLSRTPEQNVSYDAIEKLKDGLWFSGKYKSKMTMIRPPRVVIFSHFPPKESTMSSDRWRIIDIDNYTQQQTRAA